MSSKKLSVAEILAAARKADSQTGDAANEPVETPEEAPASKPAKAAGKVKPAKSASGGRLSVAEMLAVARGGKQAGADASASKKPAAKKPVAKKPAAKAKPKGTSAKAASGPKDTASILAAARGATRRGPISKAEAAKKTSPKGASAKPKMELPPMPVKPTYAQAAAAGKAKAKKGKVASGSQDRRGFMNLGMGVLAGIGVLWALAVTRFMFPNVLREPPSRFKVGYPGDFPPGSVETKFKPQQVWIVHTEFNGELQLYALKTVCTHLGCTPNWLEAEQKFKCPCHGSGYYKDGINFEGPAPRPLERFAIKIADDGQVEIDKSRVFQEEMGQWADPASFITV